MLVKTFQYLSFLVTKPSKWRLRELLLALEWQRKQAQRYLEGIKEKIMHLQRELSKSREKCKALQGKIFIYEKVVRYAHSVLQATEFEYIAESLKRAYDEPIQAPLSKGE